MAIAQKNRPEDWKDQYFKALNELDDLEREHAGAIGRLSRSLLAVLGTHRGADPEFDQRLDRLERAKNLADGQAQQQLRALVDALGRRGGELETAPPPPSAPATPTTSTTPAPDAPPSPPGTALPEALHALFEAVHVPERLSGHAGELRDRLARAKAATGEAEIIESIASILTRMLGAEDGQDALADARDSLQTLIDHLSLPAVAHETLSEITPRLQDAATADGIRAVAKELASFFVEYVGTLQSEIDGLNEFLVTINGRLHDVSSHIGHENDGRAESAAAREELGASVRRSLGDMRIQIRESSDLDGLKHDIEQQLARIDDDMGGYLASETERAAQAERRSTELADKLDTLEKESEALREKLVEAHRRAVQDPLTGLPNRMAYNTRLRTEHARFKRSGHPLSIVMLDIDRFKAINDTYGHLAGDRVLKHMARELGSQIREQDFFGRFGGEEFVLLLPDTPMEGALKLADNLRAHMESCRFKYKKTPVQVTISCGIAEFRLADTPASALHRADAGLYAAKENGRNRCEAVDSA